ncbi:MAG: hypothetical protein QM639_14135 [Rhodocyclaceae bacterium]
MMARLTIQVAGSATAASPQASRGAVDQEDVFGRALVAQLKARADAASAASATDRDTRTASTTQASLVQGVSTQQKSSSEAFSEYMAMTPAERMRFSIMAGMGISPEEYAAMTPEEQEAIDAKVAERIRQLTEEKTDDSAARHAATQLKAALASVDGQGDDDSQRRLNLLA